MSDLDDRLRRDLRAGGLAPLDLDELIGDVRRRIVRRRRRLRRAAVGASAVLVLCGALFVARDDGDSSPAVVPAGPQPSIAPSSTDGTVDATSRSTTSRASASPDARASAATARPLADVAWQPIAANPLGVRDDAVAVWTGTEALTWGGRDDVAHADGAAYDPATNTWRVLAANGLAPRVDEVAVWTGSEMLLVGGTLPDGRPLAQQMVAYDPLTDTWRERAAPPITVTAADAVVWAGSSLVVWNATGQTATYDPATDTWSPAPAAPIAARARPAAVWTGVEMIVWGGIDGADRNLGDGAAFDPATRSWRALADGPLSPRVTTAVWTGSTMVVRGGYSGSGVVEALGDGAEYDPTADRWTPIVAGPAHPGFGAVWTGALLVELAKGMPAIWEAAPDRWVDPLLSGGPAGQQAPVWTGRYVLVFGRRTDGRLGGGAALDPSRLTLS